MSLQLYQEPVTPTGGHKSEGVQNVLGRPPMNWISVVLREAVQNSWDARQNDGPVDFEIRWFTPSKAQKDSFRDLVFTNEPQGEQIRQTIQKGAFDVLVFTDRGTRGLDGPLLANEESVEGKREISSISFGRLVVQKLPARAAALMVMGRHHFSG